MVARDVLIGGVLAATDKLVKQVGQGDWSSVSKTIEQRRMLLDALTKTPQAGEHDFVKALRDAAAESETALKVMNKTADAASSKPTSSICTKA